MNDHLIASYDYDLPRERIAQEPAAVRSDARLMVLDRQSDSVEHCYIRDLPEILAHEDTLILNNSRVVPARLLGHRTRTEGRWQGLYLRSDPETGIWEVLSKTRGRLQIGESITLQDRKALPGVELQVIARTETGNLLVKPLSETPTSELLHQFGWVPIPPYIRDGRMVDADVQAYQTVYAQHDGSVAAPTAGLHFTQPLLNALDKKGVRRAEVTLHVGIGTFRPISVDQLEDHEMHTEWASLSASAAKTINDTPARGGKRIAVGTTSVRTVESAAAEDGTLAEWSGPCNLFITPGYSFKAIDGLLTNFHLPRSSLLVLVSALAGRERIMKAYQEAIDNEYRFFSYGDAMLIL
ncbi:S-adenosylmethionine:tRNA ribosyltransferase-isomerase [Roseimaritima multifibrata]|uniref:S-adenosylmethionine:tRNA ribosyltransferase-isomerase n=1 Tax=Roseimaritima multifibrata TaxID=1930274 RepID=A0A517MAV4_9BACT|nr:tRNA preQ1(34) S-adenosylmethionine ribosyltransferase-isomerase QueA [Roseimaritima multifibrata]QDS92013.1 S-adenosylmethionine:tRNA ribosyltransferase-isomerase [Roseimaritima multifibrata]